MCKNQAHTDGTAPVRSGDPMSAGEWAAGLWGSCVGNRSSGFKRHFPLEFTMHVCRLGSPSFDLSGLFYVIALTLVGKAEALGHCSVSCKGIERLEN